MFLSKLRDKTLWSSFSGRV